VPQPGEVPERSTVPVLVPGEPVGTSYLVFIDDYFSLRSRRDTVLADFKKQLSLVGPDDRMAVVAFDGQELALISNWTSSVEALERAFDQAMERSSHGAERLSEEQSYENNKDGMTTPKASFSAYLGPEEKRRVDEISRQVERIVLATSSALRSFAKPPGRKVMILFSGGWPYNPAQGVVADSSRAIFAGGDEVLAPLVETANRLGYTLYPVDALPRRGPGPGAEQQSSDPNFKNRDKPSYAIEGDPTAQDAGAATAAELSAEGLGDAELSKRRDQRRFLDVVAGDTGGEAVLGAASVHAFEQIVEDTRSYYWLGFTPSWQGDDKAHRIAIETRGKELEVRTRHNFSDLSRQSEVSMMVESALLFGDLPSAAPMRGQVGPLAKAGRGKVDVPISLEIPLFALTFLPSTDGFVADTELRFAAFDGQGNSSEVPVVPLKINARRPPGPGETSTYKTQIRVRNKKQDLVVSLYDNATGQIFTSRMSVEP